MNRILGEEREMRGLRILVCLFVVLAAGEVSAQTTDFISGYNLLKRVVTDTSARTTNSESFAALTSTTIWVPPGVDAMISARFSAESRCTESSSSVVNWCEARILIGGTEAEPVETTPGQDFAFDSTDTGNATSGSYGARSMSRHRCVSNAGGNTTLAVPVQVQWAVTNLDGGGAPVFWVDDLTLEVEESLGCYIVPPRD